MKDEKDNPVERVELHTTVAPEVDKRLRTLKRRFGYTFSESVDKGTELLLRQKAREAEQR